MRVVKQLEGRLEVGADGAANRDAAGVLPEGVLESGKLAPDAGDSRGQATDLAEKALKGLAAASVLL